MRVRELPSSDTGSALVLEVTDLMRVTRSGQSPVYTVSLMSKGDSADPPWAEELILLIEVMTDVYHFLYTGDHPNQGVK